MLETRMEKEKENRGLRIIYAAIISGAIIITLVAVFFHSMISPASIYQNSTVRAPLEMDLYINGTLIEENTRLPQMISVSRNDTVRLEGCVQGGTITGGDSFMISTEAPAIAVYVNGRQIYSSAPGTSNPLYDLHLNTHSIYIGQFPEDENVRTIAIEFYPAGLPFSSSFTIDRLTTGSFFALLSSLRRSVTILAVQMLVYITLSLMAAGVLAASFRTRSVRNFTLGLLLMLFQMMLMTAASSQMRAFLFSNEELWQILLILSYTIYPLCFMITFNKVLRIRFLSSPAYWILAFIPAAMSALCAALYFLEPIIAYDVFAKIKYASIAVNMIYTVLCIYEMKKDNESSAASYACGYSFLMSAAFILDMINTSEIYAVNAFDNAANMIRLTATGCYIIFSISSYYTRQQGIIGQIELDSMLYTDTLSGCYNRRNFDALRRNAGSIKEELYIIVFDINDVKMVNDCFGHSEGDRIISYFGSFITDYLPEGARIYRIGGDEFVALLPAASLNDDMDTYIEKLQEAYGTNAPYSTTIAAGYSLFSGGTQDAFTNALRAADTMMYEDKHLHKEQYMSLSREEMEDENERQ